MNPTVLRFSLKLTGFSLGPFNSTLNPLDGRVSLTAGLSDGGKPTWR